MFFEAISERDVEASILTEQRTRGLRLCLQVPLTKQSWLPTTTTTVDEEITINGFHDKSHSPSSTCYFSFLLVLSSTPIGTREVVAADQHVFVCYRAFVSMVRISSLLSLSVSPYDAISDYIIISNLLGVHSQSTFTGHIWDHLEIVQMVSKQQ